MKANELKPGNLVKSGTGIYKVFAISIPQILAIQKYDEPEDSQQNVYQSDNTIIEPIPLTAEWLKKLGFKREIMGDMWIDLMTHYLVLKFMNGFYYPMYVQLPEMGHEEEQRVSLNRIKSVHELQNLFFVLTGEELLIK